MIEHLQDHFVSHLRQYHRHIDPLIHHHPYPFNKMWADMNNKFVH